MACFLSLIERGRTPSAGLPMMARFPKALGQAKDQDEDLIESPRPKAVELP